MGERIAPSIYDLRFRLMTLLSCLALGLAFAIALGLLTLAGVLLGWLLPGWLERFRARRSRRRGPRP